MKLTQFNEGAKLTELSQASSTVCFSEYIPGTGFQTKIQQECKESNIDFIRITAHSANVIMDIETNSLIQKPILPQTSSKTLIIVEEFERLNNEQQLDFISKIKDQVTSPKMGVIIPVIDIKKISEDVLKESTFLGNSENLPPVGPGNILKDLIDSTPNVALTEIRRKYTSTGSENKATPK
jgi:hypothetical protein